MKKNKTKSETAIAENSAVINSAAGSTDSAIAEEIKLEFPGKYNVILHNDNVTPMNFVVEILVSIFSYTPENAIQKMLEIHHNGKSVIGTYIKSIAESKVLLTREASLKMEFPLNITMEKA